MAALFTIIACLSSDPPHPARDTDVGDSAAPGPQAAVVDSMPSLFTVRWQQPEPASAQVAWSLDGVWHTSPAREVGAGEAELLAAGLPFDVSADWRLIVDDVITAEGQIQTGSAPEGTPSPIVISSIPEQHAPDLAYLLASISSNGFDEPVWTVIVDRQGRLVWSLPTPAYRVTLHPRLSADGRRILIDHNSYWGDLDCGAASTVVRVGLDGVVEETIETPGLHHPFVELPDGALMWGAAVGDSEQLMRRRPGEAAEVLWRCGDFHERIGVEAQCRSNTLWHDEDTGRLLFSFFTTETVVEIDPVAQEAVRWFGQLDGGWGFERAEDAFFWQHGAQYTDEGTLLVSARTAPDVDETVVREYALDEEARQLEQVWTFGLGDGVYGAKMGEPWQLEGGHILHNYGSTPRIREATAEGEVVWDIGWTGFQFVGRSTPLSDLYELVP
jgi:hypothetical protein